ncbi:prefoldin subunit 6 [Leguminivora glycinivorella]|uniref:prefoldin subunit 6 n=1 Tax=Leguminivora glycinivorella TaxID=1035111 RepID=UPI00200D7057|nr:prefoldin subunit 6 [Leguminivora glycinivorella]
MTEEIQKKLQKEVEMITNVQKEYHKAVAQKQQLDSQLNENKAVKEELILLKKDAEVYKLIGPVLVKQDLEEAKQNVAKRMEFITKEIKRTDGHISALENKQEALQENVNKLRNDMEKLKVKA